MSTSDGVKVVISFDLRGDLVTLVRRKLNDAVRKTADEELARMGLPCTAHVFVRAGAGPRAVRIRFNGARVTYPPLLLVRAWQATVPRELHAVAAIGGDGFPDGWVEEGLAALPEAERSGVLTRLVNRLTVAVMRRRPEVLLNDDAVAAYVDKLGDDARGHDLAWGPILRPLIALTGTLADRDGVLAAVAGAAQMGLECDDVVESAFVALRIGSVELAAPARLADDAQQQLERRLLQRRGLPAPELHAVADAGSEAVRLEVVGVLGLPIATIAPDELLVAATKGQLAAGGIEATDAIDPVTALPAAIVSADRRDAVQRLDLTARDAAELTLDVLADALDEHRRRLLTTSELEYQLALLRGAFPAVVRATLATFPLSDLTRIARVLVQDGISLADLPRVLDRLLHHEATRQGPPEPGERPPAQTNGGARGVPSAEEYADGIRGGLGDLFASWCATDGAVDVVTVAGELEDRLASAKQRPRDDLEDDRIRDAAWAACAGAPGPPPIVITSPAARRPLCAVLGDELPALTVLSHAELPLDVERRIVGTLG